jgi:hypothetical protein
MTMSEEMHRNYNLMAHRVITVCSALKHDQFRALTEVTVNQLMQAGKSHTNLISESLKNQRRLNEMGVENMREFREFGEEIKSSQSENLEKLQNAGNIIEENLAMLQQELVLREKSEEALNEINQKTVEISNKLFSHSANIREEHVKLRQEVDEIASNLQKTNLEIIEQYSKAMEFLNNFNSIMSVASEIGSRFKMYREKAINTIQEVGFNFSEEFIAFMCLNILYATIGMVYMMFVNAQNSCKAFLAVLFIFNSVAALYQSDVPLLPLNIFAWSCFLGKFYLSN